MSDNNVVTGAFGDFRKDLQEFVELAENSPPFSEDLAHAVWLMGILIQSPNIPNNVRLEAIVSLSKYSKLMKIREEYAGVNLTKQIQKMETSK